MVGNRFANLANAPKGSRIEAKVGFYFGADLQGLVSASAFSVRRTFSLNFGDWRRARIDFSNSSA
jgi:hypothetical protein